MSRLETDFLSANGAAILEWASNPLAYYKILNDTAFARFQQSGSQDFASLLTRCSAEDFSTCTFGERLVGEFFDRLHLGKNIQMGDDVNVIAHGGVTLKDNVRIGNNVQLVTVFHSIHPEQRLPIRSSPIIIEEGAVIEAGALIISSRRSGEPLVIGRNARVMANSVVVSNVEPDTLVSGRPARRADPQHFLNESFVAAHDKAMNVSTVQNARELLGQEVDVCTPIAVSGADHVSSEGFYLLNRRCQLDLKGPLNIGQGVLMAPAVSLTVEQGGSLTIGRNVWIGAGAGVHARAGQHLCIGEGSIIGAGATITENVPPRVVMLEENLLKREILDHDFDHDIPSTWTDIASILDLRSQDRVDRVQQEINLLLTSGQDIKLLMDMAYENIRRVATNSASSPSAERELSAQ